MNRTKMLHTNITVSDFSVYLLGNKTGKTPKFLDPKINCQKIFGANDTSPKQHSVHVHCKWIQSVNDSEKSTV